MLCRSRLQAPHLLLLLISIYSTYSYTPIIFNFPQTIFYFWFGKKSLLYEAPLLALK